jgi:hypothetical protein
MAKQRPFTAQEERLQRLTRNAEIKIVELKGFVDTARSIVAAETVKIDDEDSPQILRVSEGGTLEAGGLTPIGVVDTITEEVSHTGDTAEATVGTITVPANSMGPNGFVKVDALFRAIGAGQHEFRTYFGGQLFSRYFVSGTNLMVDMNPKFVWNRGATNSQGSGIQWLARSRFGESVFSGAIDTTQDVDVTFTVQNSIAGDTAYLRFALVGAYYKQ